MQRTVVSPAPLTKSVSHDAVLSPTLQINEQVGSMWAAGEKVFHMGFGESRFPVHPKLQAALAENSHRKDYLPVQGLPALREAIAAYDGRFLQMPIDPAQVIVGPGSKILLFALQMALDGDLFLPTPTWVSYAPQARLLGKRVHFIEATSENGYALTIEALEVALRKTNNIWKILLITSPNNPTGCMLDLAFLEELALYCRQNNIIVISDEIYAQVPHGMQSHVSLSRFYPEGTVVVGGLSKHLSLGGWRLGKAIIPLEQPDLMPALRTIASETWSTPSGPVQYAAITAYSDDADIEAYIAECAQIHATRTQYVWNMLEELGVACQQPQGGFYMMPNFDRWREPLAAQGVTTSNHLANYLLKQYHIATLPGTAFGVPEGELSLRLATSYLDMETDAAAGKVLGAWRQGIEPETFIEAHHPQLGRALALFQSFISDLVDHS